MKPCLLDKRLIESLVQNIGFCEVVIEYLYYPVSVTEYRFVVSHSDYSVKIH